MHTQSGSRRQSLGGRATAGLPEARGGVDQDGPALDKKVGPGIRAQAAARMHGNALHAKGCGADGRAGVPHMRDASLVCVCACVHAVCRCVCGKQ